MQILLVIGSLSFAVVILLTPVIRDWFLRRGIIDKADSHRKLHTGKIPRIGGIVILVAYLSSLSLLLFPAMRGLLATTVNFSAIFWLAIAIFVVFATGLADDLWNLKPWQKLAGELFGAVIAYLSGVEIHLFAGTAADQWLCAPVTILWLVGCTNAFNLIDGLDGLASGVGLLATAAIFIAAVLDHNMALALVTAPLAGCLLGFLRYNFAPASVYLGDCGSLPVGFLLGCCGALWGYKSATILGMAAPIMALSVPLLDTCLSIARRFLRNKPIFGADRGHIHHRLLDKGLSPRRVVLILYCLGAMAATLSLLHQMIRSQFSGLAVVIFCAAAWLGIQRLGYLEFRLARKLVTGGGVFRMVDDDVRLHQLRDALNSSPSIERSLEVFTRTCKELGFGGLRLSISGQTREERFEPATTAWQIRINIPGGYVNLSGSQGVEARRLPLDTLVELIQTTLTRKFQEEVDICQEQDRQQPVAAISSRITVSPESAHVEVASHTA